jgi:N,N'-diacetyllegionaminate synthase
MHSMKNNMRKTFIIAEAGVNHNGSVETAYELIRAAREAGSDAVKFQTFNADAVTVASNVRAEYQRKSGNAGDTQHAMLKALELNADQFSTLASYCRELGIRFLSTPFDIQSVGILGSIGVDMYKIASGEITNTPLLRAIGAAGRPIILSTGMSTLGEIETALDAIYSTGNRDVRLLHCVTEYPAPFDEINLRAMETMRIAFRIPVGYSDHTTGIETAVAAVALGAEFIEKHLTLDRTMEGPDHGSSAEPALFAEMVRAIERVESAMGDGVKRPAPCELKNMPLVRRSLVAASAIRAGEKLQEASIAIKRPGTGIAPRDLDTVVGMEAAVDIRADEVLTWEMLKRT